MNRLTQSIWAASLGITQVGINIAELFGFVYELWDQDLALPDWRTPIHPENDKRFVEFLGVSNAINFCFTDFETGDKFDVEYGGRVYTGAFAMGAALARALAEGRNLLRWEVLADLNRSDAERIFQPKNTHIPLLEGRVHLLNNFGITMIEKGYGTFFDFLEDCDFRACNYGRGFVERLAFEFPCYKDESPWGGIVLQFAKRAQLTALMYYGRSTHSTMLPKLKDPQNLGPAADYSVPKVLRSLGILFYNKSLSEAVDRGEVLPQHGEQEVAIRAKTIEAMCVLLEEINWLRKGKMKPLTHAELDYWAWSQHERHGGFHHRVRTCAY